MAQNIYLLKNSFSAGEISDKAYYRSDFKKFTDALAYCENFYPEITGSISARQGTQFIAKAKYDTRNISLETFIYSATDNYVLEIGYKYIRFFQNLIPLLVSDLVDGIVLGNPIVITSGVHPFNLGTDVTFQNIVGTTELNGNTYLIANVTTNTFKLCDQYFGVRIIENTTKTNPCTIKSSNHGLITGDVVCIDDIDGMTELNGNHYTITKIDDDWVSLNGVDATSYGLYEKYGEIRKAINGTTFTPYVSDGDIIAPYEVVTPYDEDDVKNYDSTYINQQNKSVFTVGTREAKVLTRIAFDNFSFETAVFEPSISPPSTVTVTRIGSGTGETYRYYVTAVNIFGEESLPRQASSDVIGNNELVTLNKIFTDQGMRIVAPKVTDAISYNIYRALASQNYAIKRFLFTTPQPAGANLDVYDHGGSYEYNSIMKTNPPVEYEYFNQTNGYAEKCCFFAERLTFSRLRTLFLSNSTYPFNFTSVTPKGSIDSFTKDLSGKDNDKILWLIDMNRYLLVGTYSKIYRIYPYDNRIVEENTLQSSKETNGSTNIYPLELGDYLLYCQEYGRSINELIYRYELSGYRSETISYIFEHLLIDGIVNWSFKDDNDSWINIVTASGELRTLIYERNQLVAGAVRHSFQNAFFLDVVNVPGDLGSDTYFAIEREINGKKVRYIEYLNPRFEGDNLLEFWGLDCASLFYDDTPFTLLTGLEYLIGEEVVVVNDLGRFNNYIVNSNGQINLDNETTYALVGYKIVNKLKTLPSDIVVQNAMIQSNVMRKKQIKNARIAYKNSLGFFVSSSEENLFIEPENEIDLINLPEEMDIVPSLKSGFEDTASAGDINNDGTIFIYKDKPFPLNILYIAMEIEFKTF